MMDEKRVPLAWSVRWRRIRGQAIPIVTFVAALVAANLLWMRSGCVVQAVGEVDDLRVTVTSPTTGRVIALPHHTQGQWALYDQVRAGDVIAHLEGAEPGAIVEVTAPIGGTLVDLACWPGQTVIPGAAIATISADQSSQVIGFIPEGSQLQALPGMRVTMRPRVAGSQQYVGKVEQVGQQIEELPRHQRVISSMPQWGTPVRIQAPDDAQLKPGTLVDLRFELTQ
jgi:multidrug resistance efflux pump